MLTDTKGSNMKTKQPNIAVETFLSLVKYFLIFVVLNNLVWAACFMHYVTRTITDGAESIEMLQDGHDNNQSITNG